MKCRICSAKTREIIDFGMMPIANGFMKDPKKKEYLFDLAVEFCPRCFMVQLKEQPAAEKMFHDHYQFISSTSKGMAIHFEEEAKHILKLLSKKKDPLVVEIGSNDGIMLRHIAKKGMRHLGVEPSANVAKMAEDIGVTVYNGFFSDKTEKQLLAQYGAADIFCGSNVTCHIAPLNGVAKGVYHMLKDDGMWFFEDPYLYDIVKLSSFDQIYDEHVYYFSGLSVANFAKQHGFSLVDMKHQDVHGGSMRYYLKKGNHPLSGRAKKYVANEKRLQLQSVSGYKLFKKRVDTIARDLRILLTTMKKKERSVAAYGATSKSTTLLTYAGVGPDLIDYVSDNTPTKIGLYTPKMHIPVKSHDVFVKNPPDYMVLLAWNHQREIFKKESGYRAHGGKFITFFPRVRVV